MEFLDKLKQKLKSEGAKMLKSRPDEHRPAANLSKRFDPIDEKALEESGEAMLSFIREHCIRGNARKFRIFLDGSEVYRIALDAQCGILCPPGFHKLYVKLDSLTSPVLNVKAEAGRRYCFSIACTMEAGMILEKIEVEGP